ncbi:MAG TPA: glycosyltransferase family 39 protein [Candidatus Kapabacteria bacterium]|nr:glycosyltransferase family 39 protein [Candidatus Kapabacteria bacterium]
MRKRLLFIVIPVILLILLPELLAPFNDDNELFHSMGFLHHAFGRIPYAGLWDQNFPGIVWLHSTIISIFGVSPFVYRAVDLIAQLLIAGLLALTVNRYYGRKPAIIASILYSLDYMYGGFWLAGQRDSFGSLLMLIATMLFIAVRKEPDRHSAVRSSIYLVVAGLCMGAAISFRPTQGLFALVLGVTMLIYGNKKRWKWAASYFCGIIGIWALILFMHLAPAGAVSEFYLDAIRYNIEVFNQPQYRGSPLLLIIRPREIVYHLALIGWLFFYIRKNGFGNITQRIQKAPMEVMLFAGYYIAAKAGVIIMGKYFISHYHPQFVLTAILGALVIKSIIAAFGDSKLVNRSAIAVLVVLIGWFYAQSMVPPFLSNVFAGKGTSLHELHETKHYGTNDWQLEYDAASNYLLAHGAAGNRLEVWGWCPGLYWRTGCNSSSRFPIMLPLIQTGHDGKLTSYQHDWQQEFIDSLTKVPPKFIVIAKDSMGLGTFYFHDAQTFIDSVKGFRDLLTSNYRLDTMMAHWDIFQKYK